MSPTATIEITNALGAKTLWLDTAGDLHLSGTIFATNSTISGNVSMLSGTIGTSTQGFTVNSIGFQTLDGVNYLRGDGTLHWGALSIDSAGNSTFSGNISANKISGTIVNSQIGTGAVNDRTIGSINANKIVAGNIQGIDIWGSIISWGGVVTSPLVKMYGEVNPVTLKQDIALIQAQGGISLQYVDNTFTWQNGMGQILLGLNTTKLFAQDIEIGDLGQSSTTIVLSGILDLSNIYQLKSFGGRTGITGNFIVNTTSGIVQFTYANGILVNTALQ